MSDSICSAFNRNVVPALLTTFSSIITEPKSFAPYPSAICPISGPCVTQELCTLSMLSRKIRARACVRKCSANECREPAAPALLFANPSQMLDSIFNRLHMPEHHRRARFQSELMRDLHHLQPFVAVDFQRRNFLPHAIHQNFTAASW